MRTFKSSVIGVLSILMLAGSATPAEDQQAPGARVASCLVKMTIDPAIMPLDPLTVESLVASSGVAGKAAGEVLVLPDPQMLGEIIDGIEVEWLTDDIVGGAPPAPRMPLDAGGTPAYRSEAQSDSARNAAGTPGSTSESNPGGFSQDGFSRGGTGFGGGGGFGGMGGLGGMGRSGFGGSGLGGFGGAGMGVGGYGLPTPARSPDVQQSATIRLRVELPEEVKPAAEQFLNALVRNCYDALVSGAFGAYESQLTDLLMRAENRHGAAAQELAQLSQGAPDVSLIEMDVRDLAARRRELVREVQDIEMDLAAMDARRKAIEEQIARTRAELDDRQRNDDITRELQRILQTNEQLASNLRAMTEAGTVSQAEFVKAQEGVAKARIELARRREELAKAAGGGRLGTFGDELSRMAIDAAEAKARLQMLEQRLAETEAQLKQASRFDPKAAQIRMAREALEVAERRVVELKRRLAGLEPPVVTVIGAN